MKLDCSLSDRWMYYLGLLVVCARNEEAMSDLKHIQNLIDAEEQGLLAKVVHGEWILENTYQPSDSHKCSECGIILSLWATDMKGISYYRNYCPNCGAKMDGKEEGAV